MTRRKSIFGVSLLCAICLCAFGAASATATTLYVCEKVAAGTGTWNDANCEEPGGKKEFATKATGLNVPTTLVGNSSTAFVLNATIAKTAVTISCKREESTGTATNTEIGGIQHNEGSGMVLTFKECVFAGLKGCALSATTVVSEKLTSETFTEAAVTYVRFLPPASGTLIPFTLATCSNTALNGAYQFTGNAVGRSENSTLVFDTASNKKGTLSLLKEPASIIGTTLLTVGGKRTMLE
jgi:hypothetical protein